MNINARLLPEAGRDCCEDILAPHPLSRRQLPCGPAAMAPGGPESQVCGRNSGPSRLMHLFSEPDRRGEDKAVGWRPRHCPSGQVPPCGVDSWDAGRRHPRPQDNSATPKQPAFGEGPSTEGPERNLDGGRGSGADRNRPCLPGAPIAQPG